jgi:alpha-amylase
MDLLLERISELWEMLQDLLPDLLRVWPTPALQHMRLGPPDSADNPLMVCNIYNICVVSIQPYFQLQAFTWEAEHASMSWWKHIEDEIPALAELGITQLWLPPPNKAMRPVSERTRTRVIMVLITLQKGQGYDAYDLVWTRIQIPTIHEV